MSTGPRKNAWYWSLFGAPLIAIVAAAWKKIKNPLGDNFEIKLLLCRLVLLKVYAKNQNTHCVIVDWPTMEEFNYRLWHIII